MKSDPTNRKVLDLHEQYCVKIDQLGQEREPVVVIDNFLAEPQLLVEHAANSCEFKFGKGIYPGVRAPVPRVYMQALYSSLHELVCTTFGLGSDDIGKAECAFSMVATPPERLLPMQRIPHFDSNDKCELAMIHYLCDGEHGGTSFYRHRETGFESIDKTRRGPYFQALETQAKTHGLPEPAYINGDTPLFERIASYPAVFNRALIYRCTSLHSGDIAEDFKFDTNPRTGRLSINTFLVRG